MPGEITLFQIHHNHLSDEDDGEPNMAKGTAMAVLFICSFSLGSLPIKLSQWYKWNSNARENSYVKMLLGFGGGVLLCTTFIHLLPEVSEHFDDLDLTPNIEIHYAELLMCIGFFIMYLVEECVHVYLHNKQKQDLKPLRRSLSVRRGDSLQESPKLNGNLHHHQHIVKEEDCQFDNTHADHSHVATYCDHNHGSNNHADHSHVVVNFSDNPTVAIVRGLLVVLALSIHELFEGLAIGLEHSSATVWYMFGAVSAHKLVIAFCIGVELVTSRLKTSLILIYVFTFAIVSPLGIGIGIILSNVEESTTVVSVILQGLASGTLMYIVFFEILQSDKKSGLKQYFAILIGFTVMFAITLID